MYNRYVRNDEGVYRRINVDPPHAPPRNPPQEGPEHERPGEPCRSAPPPGHASSPLGGLFGKDGLLSGVLGKLKLDEIDTGDLLLLVILFLLFRDGEDEELLIALGLLLIL